MTHLTQLDRTNFATALSRANKYGMIGEFLMFYRIWRRWGLSPSNAMSASLDEWDI